MKWTEIRKHFSENERCGRFKDSFAVNDKIRTKLKWLSCYQGILVEKLTYPKHHPPSSSVIGLCWQVQSGRPITALDREGWRLGYVACISVSHSCNKRLKADRRNVWNTLISTIYRIITMWYIKMLMIR